MYIVEGIAYADVQTDVIEVREGFKKVKLKYGVVTRLDGTIDCSQEYLYENISRISNVKLKSGKGDAYYDCFDGNSTVIKR